MKLLILLKKELIDQIRDRRMILAALLMPAVIVPLLLVFMTLEPSMGEARSPVRVAIDAESIGLQEIISASFTDILFIRSHTPGEIVRDGGAEIGIASMPTDGERESFTLHYDPARRISELAYARVHSVLQSHFTGAEPRTDSLSIRAAPIRSAPLNSSLLTLSLLLPVFLMVFSASTTMSSAIDLSSGEKERSTIETLLSTNISRTDIVAGKILAASVVGITAVAALLTGMIISSWAFPRITGGVSLLGVISLPSIFLIGAHMLFCVLLFASLGLATGLYSKSVKEGTVLTLPVIILASALSSGLIGGDPYVFDPVFLAIPVANASYVIRSILYGNSDPATFMLSILVNSLYAAVFFAAGTYLMGKETVISRS
ncbi:MAG: ABC transporter permease [Spirochaetaceae bacterium]|nr:MAG: ABC transporter permease [Spirochaetaceae bacterium]